MSGSWFHDGAHPRTDATGRGGWTLAASAYLTACLVFDAWLLLVIAPPFGGDARSWHEINLANLYGQATQSLVGAGAFRYAPIIGQLLAPLAGIPWAAFLVGLAAVQIAAVVAMTGRRWWVVIAFPPVILELIAGNIELLMAAAIVLGFRWPATWAFLILTKVTPGVGVLWFAFRREWRALAIAIGTTAVIVAAGVLVSPGLWADWVRALVAMNDLPNPTPWPSLAIRLPLAILLLWWAARGDHRWAVPVVALIAMPTIWAVSFALLGGSFALLVGNGQSGTSAGERTHRVADRPESIG